MNTFYVSPNQVIKDKTEFAKKGIEKAEQLFQLKQQKVYCLLLTILLNYYLKHQKYMTK